MGKVSEGQLGVGGAALSSGDLGLSPSSLSLVVKTLGENHLISLSLSFLVC